ncbi:MarR family transcriptional regulator [Listeria booriae]|uniref:MarR family transcriptional regulator n=1 Tax=Listeria booriae TaxID=1552123 RepID=A0A7X1CZG0_9LIST|nr:MarR family transcriptional regulator [Listeria booriae]MBC1209978.1 MarR family transcriptional regulator [Listeria booriae]MBC1232642.1 MarR family transcriptional regulator [Listeria booriae]MBC1246372.1 MarR family transcriptional regulator [Listeria booriae]MBC1315510.1 MarR family transcriptional regulator [Listeria booriae]MBC2097737.1 MarR family transcriptional regulator [Listeria booriae]
MEDIDLKLFTVLLRSANWIQKVHANLVESHGITPSEFGVLEQLYHLGPQQLQALGQKNLISNGNTTYMVTKLEKKNYLVRVNDPNDRRVVYAKLTAQGTQFISNLFPQFEVLIKEQLTILSEEEKEILISGLKKIGLNAESHWRAN